MKCDVYLSFDGNCEEAMNFYQQVFGGEFTVVMRYADGPPQYIVKGTESKIMHMTLSMENGAELKAADVFNEPVQKGNAYHVSIGADSEEQGEEFFNKLVEGAQITMPFQNVFWGGKFGSLIDRYGIQWMISTPHKG
ncbi:VOC family protein [Pseudotenacibaculum sp. MALMAid0570]|uniref:VOC family protein n=1 Tax=Pseudotenacibaculum sp. MALMAid0570 TaxID=3143938 RepID=UPI0032E048C3